MAAPPLLEPAFLARLERLQLSTRRPLVGLLSGEHRSPRHGSSTDFSDHWPYHQGDDYRRIDYGLLARLDVVLIKLFEAEEDLTVRLLIDTSSSMGYGGKLRQAARAAAALGFVALARRDAVTVHTLSRVGGAAPRFAGRASAPQLLSHLAGLTAGGGTPFLEAARDLLARRGPPGLTVVVSDLLTPSWRDGLRLLPARGGDVVVVHVLAASDLDPSVEGDVEVVDAESGASLAVALTPDVRNGYRRRAAAWLEDVSTAASGAGAGYVRLLAEEDLESALLGAWRTAAVVR